MRANDAGEIEWAEGVLGEMLPKIIRKRLRKRIVTIQAELLNEARQVELAIRMEDDPEAVFPKKGPLNLKIFQGSQETILAGYRSLERTHQKDNKITWSGERWNKAGSRIMSMSV